MTLSIANWYVTHAAIARAATCEQLTTLARLSALGRAPRVTCVDRLEQALMCADELAIMTGRAAAVVSAHDGTLAYTSHAHLTVARRGHSGMTATRPTVPVPPSTGAADSRGAYERALELARQDDLLSLRVSFDLWFRAAVRGVRPRQVRALRTVPAERRVAELVALIESGGGRHG